MTLRDTDKTNDLDFFRGDIHKFIYLRYRHARKYHFSLEEKS